VNLGRPEASLPPAAVYGPEPWRTIADMGWSYWDLWFCMVCVADHGGDWGALDEAIQLSDKHHGGQKWSHLQDLTERLDRAGLTADDLVGASPREPKLRAKARTKMLKSSLYRRDLTPAMRNPPSVQLTRRALSAPGRTSPLTPALVRLAVDPVPRRQRALLGRMATRTLAYAIAEAADDMAARAGMDAAQLLAARRRP
jgi:hypothetical protein